MQNKGNEGELFALTMGRYLKRKLKETGMTQQDFGDEFGCDVRTVSRWLKGSGKGCITNVMTACDITGFFGDSLRDVVFGEDDVSLLFYKTRLAPVRRSRAFSVRTFCAVTLFLTMC